MARRHSGGLGCALLTALALWAAVLACGGTATPTASGACGDLYDALSAYGACFPPSMPPLPRRDRFVLNCEAHLSAAGADGAPAAAERCVAALKAATPACGTVDDSACVVPPGSLGAGQPCGTSLQCASSYCVASAEGAAEGDLSFLQLGAGLTACGVCVDRVALGDRCELFPASSCNPGCQETSVPCAKGAQCFQGGDAGPVGPDGGLNPVGTCVALPAARAPSGVGGACTYGSQSDVGCQSDLHCTSNGTCAAQSPQGGACHANSDCAGELLCTPNGTCGAGLTLGQTCTPSGFELCTGDLLCDATSLKCEPPFYVSAGAACNGFNIFCATGPCSTNLGGIGPPQGKCPDVITDGQPCGPSSASGASAVCDDYATCTPPPEPRVCCTPDGGPIVPSGPDAGGAGTCVRLDPSTCR